MMRLKGPHSSCLPQQLFAMLKDAKAREKESWRNSLLSNSIDKMVDIGPSDRDFASLWMLRLNSRLEFYPETFFLALNILDRFLTSVKSPPKYLKCIAVTCLYLASKLMEEEEVIPGTGELVENSECGCRVQDILRMERIILSKLDWDLHVPTALTYLQIFHALAFSRQSKPDSDVSEKQQNFRSSHLALLTEELQHAVCRYRTAAFPSAAVALALLSVEIENLSSDSSNWVSITSQLQAHADIRTNDLMSCRESLMSLLPRRLCNPCFNNPVYLMINPSKKTHPDSVKQTVTGTIQQIFTQGCAVKRKADTSSLTAISDGIKKFHTYDVGDEAMHLMEEESSSEMSMPDLAQPGPSPQGYAVDPIRTATQVNGRNFDTVNDIYTAAAQSSINPTVLSSASSLSTSCDPRRISTMKLVSTESEGCAADQVFEHKHRQSIGCEMDENAGERGGSTADALSEGAAGCSERDSSATQMRPLTYAEIVKCGILGTSASVAAIAVMSNVSPEACF